MISSGATVSRDEIADALELKATAILEARDPERVQPHSRKLPTDIELAEAAFAARQLRIAADEVRSAVI